jgi:nucleotide-binding universal stress UspA family protein
MSIKHILVHLDHSLQSRSRLEYAVGMARRQQAFLTGCFAISDTAFSPGQERKMVHRAEFLKQTGAFGIDAQWLNLEERGQTLMTQLYQLSQCTDLVIVGQSSLKRDTEELQELPEQLVLISGRPVLILPYAGQFNPNCERVMVAWNGGRESVRSLHDALPLLQQAKQVNLLSLLRAGTEVTELESSLAILCSHLAHHNIMAHTQTQICVEVSKGNVLLNRCAEEGIDLLVAGGYYHGHLGEVAMHLLKHMTVPVLMSH